MGWTTGFLHIMETSRTDAPDMKVIVHDYFVIDISIDLPLMKH